MSSSNIQKTFDLIQKTLAVLSINVFVEFKNLNIFSKIYRIFSMILVTFFYFLSFIYTFILNCQNPSDNLLDVQFLLFNAIIGLTTILMRIFLSFVNRQHYVTIFDWIIEIHNQENSAIHKYVGAKYEKLGRRYLRIWR